MFNTGTGTGKRIAGWAGVAGLLLLAALVACTPTQPQRGNSTPSTKAAKTVKMAKAAVKPAAHYRLGTGQPSSAWKRAVPAPAAPVAAPAKIAIPQTALQPDWTRLFKAWENGCANSAEFDAFEKKFTFFGRQRAGQQAQIELPAIFKAATGAPTSGYRVDYSSAILPVTAGSYYGIPLKSIEFYSGHENGIRGKQILLGAPENEVKKILKQKKVVFKKGKTHRAVVSGTAMQTAVTCDASD